MSKPMTPEERAEKRYPASPQRHAWIIYEQQACATTIREEVEPLELKVQEQADELAKLRELVQVLVDALEGACYYARTYEDCPYLDGDKALATAKEQGFVPTNTEDK